MERLIQDVTRALRMFRDSPVFAVTAILTLTLGIGANTAIFSVVNAVILKPVPFADPDTLIQIVHTENGRVRGAVGSFSSPAKYLYWRAQVEAIEDVAAYRGVSLNYSAGGTPERLAASQVTASFFRAFRAPMALGRPFSSAEDTPGAAKTTVISYDFWTRRLASDPKVIGTDLSFSGVPYTIVGVMARAFDSREFGKVDAWVPLQLEPSATEHGDFFQVAARLKRGVSLQEAQARLAASTAAFRERFPSVMREGIGFSAVSFQEGVVGREARNTLWVLFGAVGFVLLIACANVANLLLIRASGRRREIAIRAALGAGRWRIVRQLLIESALLSVVGGVFGLVLGFLGIRALLAINTAGLPRLGEAAALLAMDWRVVGFTLALSVVTGLLFGLVPAAVTSAADLTSIMRSSGSGSGSGVGRSHVRSILVVSEIGLAVVLLIGAALLIRTSLALGNVDPGFTVDNVLVARTSLAEPRFQTTAALNGLAASTLEGIRAIPNVKAATASCCVPLQRGFGMVFNIVGRDDAGPFTGGGDISISTGDYFETFEIPILRGRGFNDRDDLSSLPVVVINRTLAERFWTDGQDPLEGRMLIGGGAALMKELADEPIRQVIGIVDDVRGLRLSDAPRPIMYLPLAQISDALLAVNLQSQPLAWIVRTDIDPLARSASIQNVIRQSTAVAVTDVQPMEQVLAVSISRQRMNMLLMSVFGGVALLLAAIGIYGLMAFAVQQRTQEIGIRLALGAQRSRVWRMVVRQGLWLIVIGTTIGLVAAYFLSDLLAAFLFGVEPRDAAVFVGVPVVLGLVAVAAVAIPARRASRADPLNALRHE